MDLKILELRRKIGNLIYIRSPLLREAYGECLGVCVLMIFGDGVIAQVILSSNNHPNFTRGDFFSIQVGWGLAVAMALLSCGHLCPGHINPAVSIAFTLTGKCKLRQCLAYIPAQFLGSFIGTALIYAVYHDHLDTMAANVDNSTWNPLTTGGVFTTWGTVSAPAAMFDQIVATGLLAYGVLMIVDPNNFNIPGWFQPFAVGTLVTTIVGCFAYNAGAPINPARDISPRIFMLMAGWGKESFTANNFYFWGPNVGSTLGAIIGTVLYDLTIGLHLQDPKKGQGSESTPSAPAKGAVEEG